MCSKSHLFPFRQLPCWKNLQMAMVKLLKHRGVSEVHIYFYWFVIWPPSEVHIYWFVIWPPRQIKSSNPRLQ